PDEPVEEADDEHRSGGAPGVAEGERTAVRADATGIEAQLVAAGEDLPGEGLVDLDGIEVLEAEVGALQGQPGGGDEAASRPVGGHAGGGGGEDAEPGQAEAWLQRGVDDGDRGGAVADAAGVAGGHGAAVAEGRAQPGEPLRGEGGTWAVVAHDVPEGHDLVV